MKEIKAYVQRSRVNQVVDKLEQAGAPGITIVEIHPVGYGFEPNYFEPQFEDAIKRYRHLAIVKIEVVCAARKVNRLARIIADECRTGEPGDGMIFISDVSAAIRIRDGATGERAL